jgi:hypothetical protein
MPQVRRAVPGRAFPAEVSKQEVGSSRSPCGEPRPHSDVKACASSVDTWNGLEGAVRLPGKLLVADDALGGFFAVSFRRTHELQPGVTARGRRIAGRAPLRRGRA